MAGWNDDRRRLTEDGGRKTGGKMTPEERFHLRMQAGILLIVLVYAWFRFGG